MPIKQLLPAVVLALLIIPCARAAGFDHSAWDALLKAHVSSVDNGLATVVDYGGMSHDRAKLNAYLRALAKVDRSQFDRWPKHQQLAFLINAYNASTVALILTAWPDIQSIKDLGGLFSSPWHKKFIPLLGKTRTLDNIEHQLIRGSGRYRDPRIHFAVNCASIGCPALRREAYVGRKLDRQLAQQTSLFLRDASRNRLVGNTLMLSPIFKWYREDFSKGWQGYHSLVEFLAAHAKALGLTAKEVKKLTAGTIKIQFLDYDWDLNKKAHRVSASSESFGH